MREGKRDKLGAVGTDLSEEKSWENEEERKSKMKVFREYHKKRKKGKQRTGSDAEK